MNAEGKRDIYLPDGEWVHFFTGEKMAGGKWHYGIETPLHLMPVFVRPGTVIQVYPEDVDCTDEMDLSKAIDLEINNNFKGYTL